MKKVFALLLVAVMAVTCLCAALSVSAEETYTDKVNLLPASKDDVSQASENGKVDFTVSNGQLKLVRSTESGIAWPSVGFDVNKEIDLSKTPMLHLVFDVDPNSTADVDEGCGVNGIITYTVGDEEKTAQLSAVAGRDADDFRLSSDVYLDFAKFAETTGKITVVKITLSIYASDERVAEGQSITWKTLAFAGEGAAEESSEDSKAEETSSEAPAENSNTETSSAPAATSSEAPATSSTSKPATGDEGVIVFAVLGLVAVAGAAIAVKGRR